MVTKQLREETPISPTENDDFETETTPGSASVAETQHSPSDHVSVSESANESAYSNIHEDILESNQSPIQSTLPAVELDFDLMWPDAEDLFETLLATEASNSWQMPLTTLPMSSGPMYSSNYMFEQQGAFGDKPSPVSPVPSGESHKAVHNVSEMVSSLVIHPICSNILSKSDKNSHHQ